jgi:hypothetical protein
MVIGVAAGDVTIPLPVIQDRETSPEHPCGDLSS